LHPRIINKFSYLKHFDYFSYSLKYRQLIIQYCLENFIFLALLSINDRNESEVKYQLWFKPERSRLNDSSKLNSLEQRIKRIETVLGANDNKHSFLSNYLKDKSLTESVQELSAKVAQFDQSSLERVGSRLHMTTDK
jgi:hypothetical protein